MSRVEAVFTQCSLRCFFLIDFVFFAWLECESFAEAQVNTGITITRTNDDCNNNENSEDARRNDTHRVAYLMSFPRRRRMNRGRAQISRAFTLFTFVEHTRRSSIANALCVRFELGRVWNTFLLCAFHSLDADKRPMIARIKQFA